MSCDGISIETFKQCIRQLAAVSESIGDSWRLHEIQDQENGSYLSKKCHVSVSSEEDTEAVGNTIIGMEYHVAYHISYGVPVFCFDAWRLDGTKLSMEDYWKLSSSKLKESDMYQTLTQLDHPVEQRPILTLHPCKTTEIISPFLKTSKNIIISWLSVVGPYVHLTLDPVYFQHC